MEIETKNLQIDFGTVTSGNTVRNGKDALQIRQQQVTHETVTDEPTVEERKRQIEEVLKEFGTSDQVTMRYDSEIDRVIVTFRDGETREVVRQIPAKNLVSFLKNFDKLAGLVVNRRV